MPGVTHLLQVAEPAAVAELTAAFLARVEAGDASDVTSRDDRSSSHAGR